MHRSASSNRFADSSYYLSSPRVPTALRALSHSHGGVDNELPIYEPTSDAAKKERTRAKFAVNAVHVIPLVLLLCALILWCFSNPDAFVVRESTISGGKVGGMSKEGHLDSDGTGHLPVDLGDMDPAGRIVDATNTFSKNRS